MGTDQTPGGFQYFITRCVTALVLGVLPCTGGREGNICSVSAQFARLGSAVTSHPHGQGFPALVLQLLPDGQQPGRGEKIRAERAAMAQWMSDRPCCELKALGEAERGVGKGRRSAPAPWAAFGSGGLSLPARARSSPAKKEGRRVLFLLFIFFFIIRELRFFYLWPSLLRGARRGRLPPCSSLQARGWCCASRLGSIPSAPQAFTGSLSASQGRALMFNGELSVSAC